MSEPRQLFSASLAKDAVYKTGLRSFMEYRDLGIEQATHGRFRAHVIRIKKEAGGDHDLHTTGLHRHLCDFQMFYVLKGWIRFVYEGQGEHTFREGDCVLQPAGHRAQRARVLGRRRDPGGLLARRAPDRRGRRDARRGRRRVAGAMARLPDPLDTLTPEAKRVYDKITAKRGAVRGPFASLMHHPALAERVGDLGEFLRFGSTLPGDVREMAILIAARSVSQAYEWVAHAVIARREGLGDDVIERVRTRGDLAALPPRSRAPPA